MSAAKLCPHAGERLDLRDALIQIRHCEHEMVDPFDNGRLDLGRLPRLLQAPVQ